MELFNPDGIRPECVESCPTYQQCREIALNALATKMQANAVLSPIQGLEFVDEAGKYISEAEYYGVEEISPEVAQMLHDGAEALASAAKTFRDLLAEDGCEGPLQLPNNLTMCTGQPDVKRAIGDTYDDMQSLQLTKRQNNANMQDKATK